MGYYIRTVDQDFRIKKENLDRGFKRVCALNKYDSLKSGGAYPAKAVCPEESTSLSHNPNRWFGWMPWNFDVVCKDLADVLLKLGFSLETNDAGDIVGLHFDDKTGDEDAFLEALRPVVEPGSFIVFEGEHGEHWRFEADTVYDRAVSELDLE